MLCLTCEHDAPEGAKFCPECGTKLSKPKPTVTELIEEFIAGYGYEKSDPIFHRLAVWKNAIGSLPFDEIDRAELERQRDVLLGENCRTSVRNYLADLRSVFREAGLRLQDIEVPQRIPPQLRLLTTDERDRLLRECSVSVNQHLRLLVLLAMEAGLRKQESLPLKWQHVDLQGGALHVPDRIVALTEMARDGLRVHALRFRNTSPWVFPQLNGNGCDQSHHARDCKYSWYTARERAGLEGLNFEQLRHEFGMRLAMDGSSAVEIATALGLRQSKPALKYTRAVREREAIEAAAALPG